MTGNTPQIFVHVGEPKTGTTFLQQLMFNNREVLAAQGVLLPGPRPMFHWRATQDLREVEQIRNDPVGPFRGTWDQLAREALKAPRVSIVSHELLAAATAEQAARAVRSFDSADVHIVITVRDMASLLTAEWQETVKHRNTRAWEDWLGDVIDRESAVPDRDRFWFWKVHDTMAILRRWGAEVPAHNVHVVTVPPRGSSSTLLWERFAGVIGVDPASVATTSLRVNASLGLPEVELLRRVNQALPDTIPDWFYMWHVKEALAHETLAARPKTSGRLELPTERDEWAEKFAEGLMTDLRSSGYDVVGDLDELRPQRPTDSRPSPGAAAPEEIADAAVEAIVRLVDELAEAKNVGGRASRSGSAEATSGLSSLPGRAKRRLVAYSQDHMWAHNLRRRYWGYVARRSGSGPKRTGGE